jgi:hypothetical protein
MIKNKHKVPTKLWGSFKSDAAKQTFNDVMEQSLKNQTLTVHPNTSIPQKEWATICFNMGCYAAWLVSKNPLKKGDEVIDIKNGKEIAKRKVA